MLWICASNYYTVNLQSYQCCIETYFMFEYCTVQGDTVVEFQRDSEMDAAAIQYVITMPPLVPKTPPLIKFLGILHGILILVNQRRGSEQPKYVIIWDNMNSGSSSPHNLLFYTSYFWFLNPTEKHLKHGYWRCMTTIPLHTCLFCR